MIKQPFKLFSFLNNVSCTFLHSASNNAHCTLTSRSIYPIIQLFTYASYLKGAPKICRFIGWNRTNRVRNFWRVFQRFRTCRQLLTISVNYSTSCVTVTITSHVSALVCLKSGGVAKLSSRLLEFVCGLNYYCNNNFADIIYYT